MAVNNELIAHVVQKVLEELVQKKDRGTDECTGIYETVDEAVNNAVEAHKRPVSYTHLTLPTILLV